MTIPPEALELLRQKGISGVGDPPDSIRVYIESVKDLEGLPSEISGYSVQPIVSGKFMALQNRTMQFRPAPGGVSIGHNLVSAGTLGIRVFDRATKARLILSNNHVLAAGNRGKIGDKIFQPGVYDGGTEANTIGTLQRFIEILPPPQENLVDCALALPSGDDYLSDTILDISMPLGIGAPYVGQRVSKSGRSTGYTEATVVDTSAIIKVFGYPFPDGYAIFKDQIVTDYCANGGDSGSLTIGKDGRAVGLLFGGSETLTVHNKMTNVAELLGIDVGTLPSSNLIPAAASLILGGILLL